MLKIDVEADFLEAFSFCWWDDFEDVSTHEIEEEFARGDAVAFLLGFGFVAAFDEVAQGLAAVFGLAGEDVEDEGKGNLEGGREGLGRGGLQFGEGVLVPVDVAFFGWALFDDLLLFPGGCFGFEFQVFDDVLGSLSDDVADVVKATAASAPRDLFEVAHGENAGALAVIFAHLGEDDGSDGNVDPDAESVGAANDLEETALGELFDEESIFGKQARVVDADSVAEEARHFFAVGRAEVGVDEGGGDLFLFLFGAEVLREKVLRSVGGRELGEVDEVDGGSVGFGEFADFFFKGGGGVFEF